MDKNRTKFSKSNEKIISSAKIWPPIGAKAPDRSRSGRNRPEDDDVRSREEGAKKLVRERRLVCTVTIHTFSRIVTLPIGAKKQESPQFKLFLFFLVPK